MGIIILVAGILDTVFGFLILFKAKTRVQRRFAFLALTIAVWVFTNVVYFRLPTYPFVHLSYAIGAFVIFHIFHWIAEFTETRLSLIVKYSIFAVTSGMAVLSLIPGVILSMEAVEITTFGLDVGVTGHLFPVYSIPATLLLLGSLYMLLKRNGRARGVSRLQSIYVSLGFVIPIIIIIISDFLLPLIGVTHIASLDSTTTFIFIGFIAYAILRYRFFDIKLFFQKSLTQFLAFTFLLSVYIYAILLLYHFVGNDFQFYEAGLVVVVLFVGITAEPLRRVIYSYIDKLFISREKMQEESLNRVKLMAEFSLQYSDMIERTKKELRNVFPDYQTFLLTQENPGGDFVDGSGTLNINANNPIIDFLGGHLSPMVTDEIPYKADQYSDRDTNSLKQIEAFLTQSNVRTVVPFGVEGRIICIVVLCSASKKNVLFAEQIVFLKKFHMIANSAIVQADMYRMALARITKTVS